MTIQAENKQALSFHFRGLLHLHDWLIAPDAQFDSTPVFLQPLFFCLTVSSLRAFAINLSIFCWSAICCCWSPLAGCVCRHLSSLHVDPGVCRLVRWLSRAQQTSHFFMICFLSLRICYTHWMSTHIEKFSDVLHEVKYMYIYAFGKWYSKRVVTRIYDLQATCISFRVYIWSVCALLPCSTVCATEMQVFLVHALVLYSAFSFRGGWYDKCFSGYFSFFF